MPQPLFLTLPSTVAEAMLPAAAAGKLFAASGYVSRAWQLQMQNALQELRTPGEGNLVLTLQPWEDRSAYI